MKGVERESENTLIGSDCIDDFIRFIAKRRVEVTGIGMRDNHWPFGVINGFECRSLRAMGHVNHHADSIHFFNDLLTEACESAVFILITPACQ